MALALYTVNLELTVDISARPNCATSLFPHYPVYV